MKEEFKIILNMNDEMFNVFKKSLEKDNYEIVEREEKVLFIQKTENKLTEKQKLMIMSIARKQQGLESGILFVDITSAVQYLMQLPEGKEKNDVKFRWMLRQAFIKAIVEKKKDNKE